ncbi:MAG: hypothetical protein CMJ83_21285 [Planctomycetes bacterium]|nr:hypothetical protein [Planctomycetota bacterium]
MSDLAERVVDDLRAFSSDLLEVGLSSGVTRRPAIRGEGSSASLLRAIEALTVLVPSLLVELETSEAPTRYVESITHVPTGAALSRRPGDYRLADNDQIRPWRWVRTIPLPEPDPRALRWLLHLLDRQRTRLGETLERTEKRVAEALTARRGRSVWAQSDAFTLRQMLERLKEARSRLHRAIKFVQQSAGSRPIPTPTLPRPFPRSQAWVTLRRMSPRLEDPSAFLPEHVLGLLGSDVVTADLPYLYQRWCGVKIIQALHELGWVVHADPVGAVFLGGLITFHHRGHTIDLWVEPRLDRRSRHPSGFKCVRGEDVTPDYLFITPGAGGPDAFVLDATLVTAPEDLVAKGRYLDLIELKNFVRIAGCPIRRRPRLAWAAAPVFADHGKALRGDGAIGTVPMNPIDWNDRPLFDWLVEVTRHALAWSLVDSAS